jgi:hypothetical protein
MFNQTMQIEASGVRWQIRSVLSVTLRIRRISGTKERKRGWA